MQKIVAAGGVIINELQQILLIYRRQHWDLPKGKLDPNETIEQCAIREVKEEVGIQNVELSSFVCKTYHTYFDTWVKADVIKETWWYIMHTSSLQKLIPQTEEDIEQVIWVNKLQLNNYLQQSYSSIIEVFKSAEEQKLI